MDLFLFSFDRVFRRGFVIFPGFVYYYFSNVFYYSFYSFFFCRLCRPSVDMYIFLVVPDWSQLIGVEYSSPATTSLHLQPALRLSLVQTHSPRSPPMSPIPGAKQTT